MPTAFAHAKALRLNITHGYTMKIYGLIDCNSFFASCEKVFRPDLAGRPVIVLSNNDGCVVARSAEAKEMGIAMGEPFFKIKHRCRQRGVVVFSSNFKLYGDMSRRVMQCLTLFTPEIEIYSIDESFLDLSGIAQARRGDMRFLRNITETIRRWTGIPTALGIAPTKTLAKAANRLAKKSKVSAVALLDESAREMGLDALPVEDVWGVGRRLTPRLQRMGVRTALDLSRLDPLEVRKKFSIVVEQTVRELRGEECIELEQAPPPRKNIQVSRSFGQRTDSFEAVSQAVATFASRGCERLRRQGGAAAGVYVYIMTNRFQDEPQYSASAAENFDSPTCHTSRVIRTALATLRKIFRPGFRYQKAGVMLLDICDATLIGQRRYLFEEIQRDTPTDHRLMAMIDNINDTFGRETVNFAAAQSDTWRPRHHSQSPCYTTHWDDLPVVR